MLEVKGQGHTLVQVCGSEDLYVIHPPVEDVGAYVPGRLK